MNGFFYLMIIFFVMLFIAGIITYSGNDALLYKGYYKKGTRAYLRYVGKTIMFVSFSPLIAGLLSLFTESPIIIASVSILSLILFFYISIKFFKAE